MHELIITIDGPAASGKGALSKFLSKDLNLHYLETGLYYRAFALLISKDNKKINDLASFISSIDHNKFKKILKEKEKLYSKEITVLSSKLAKLANVRNFIVNIQKISIEKCDKSFNGIILEGRDCGTVIAPEAKVKIFLTASIKERAKRRFEQFKEAKQNIQYRDVLKDLNERDVRDKKRKHSPLKKANDAILLDNTDFNFDETINIVKNIIFSRIPSLKKKRK